MTPQPSPDGAASGPEGGWHGRADVHFAVAPGGPAGGPPLTVHQGGATAPLKLQRGFPRADGRLELPILHTAGGLVGGDRLTLEAALEPGSRALLTSVAAQKVYGSIGRSRRSPAGTWALQELRFRVGEGADLEWLPQELVLYGGGLFEQRLRVDLAPGAGWLGAEVVRLGRTAAGEGLGSGRWRSRLEIRRHGGGPPEAGGAGRWELVDRLELGGENLLGQHGLNGEPVFGSLVWAAPAPLPVRELEALLQDCRGDRGELPGTLTCGALDQGLVARYRGPSTTAARAWFTRLWARIRAVQGLAAPEWPRVWPFQEEQAAALAACPGGRKHQAGAGAGQRARV